MSASARGDLLLLLHAHLPFVRHPENPYHLEENWLYEAITATYLPLISELTQLLGSGSTPCLTLSLSPTLCSMLRDTLLGQRYRAYLDRLLRLGEDELGEGSRVGQHQSDLELGLLGESKPGRQQRAGRRCAGNRRAAEQEFAAAETRLFVLLHVHSPHLKVCFA